MQSHTMDLIIASRLGAQEVSVLIGLPLLYLLPIWLSFRKYGAEELHWRALSILAVLLLSWIGYLLVGFTHGLFRGFVEGRMRQPKP